MKNEIVLKQMKWGFIFLGTFISGFLFFACHASSNRPYKIETTYNTGAGYSVDVMAGNRLGGGGDYELNTARHSAADGVVNYALGIRYVGSQWIFIKPGDSLILFVDGKRLGLNGQGSFKDRQLLENGNVREIAKYPVTPELLKEIASADEVEVQIIGRNKVINRFFTAQNFDNFKKFNDTYLK